MKFNFRKISAIGSSILLAGMSIATPIAAAAYPAPFVSGGSANVAIVYGTGTGVSYLDVVHAGNIQSNLQSKMGGAVGTTSTASGEAKTLNSGSDLLYLLDDLSENVATITKDDLPTILADGDFVDDDGTSWEFEQTIAMGTSTTNRFSFGNSDSDFDDPTLMLELATATGTPMYTWTINFDKATNLTTSISEGEEITLFGKTYTIGTATDYDTLVLLGGADSTRINVGETATMSVGGVDYSVSLDGLSSDTATKAGITIDGTYKSFTEGQTKTYVLGGEDVSVYVKTVFRTGDTGTGYVEVEIGADKLTFENSDAVSVGSDNTDIDTTLVTVTPTPGSSAKGPGFGNITKLQIAVAAEDNDVNHVLAGESFTDPVFGTLKLELTGVLNGPTFEAQQDTGRTLIELRSGGSRELQATITDSAGITKTVPFGYQNLSQDDSSNPYVTVEGNNLTDDDYFFLNSGDYQHLMRVTKVNLASITTSDIEIQDQFTGVKYLVEDKDFTSGQNLTINSQTYTITNATNSDGANGGFKITRAGADAADKRALFPYLELVAGDNFPRVTFINATNMVNDGSGDVISTTANGTAVTGKVYELPTGSIQFRLSDLNADNGYNGAASAAKNISFLEYGVIPTDGTVTWANVTNVGAADGYNMTSLKVGTAWYTFGAQTTNHTGGTKWNLTNITIDVGFDAFNNGDKPIGPVLMFVEDEDKGNASARNTILFETTDDGSYLEFNGNPYFSGVDGVNYDSETWDTTEYKGWLTSYGTYVLRDKTDTNQYLASLSYGTAQMYADVYMAEVSASITAGTSAGGVSQLGDVLVKDSEVSSVATKNLIVVGGSCINSAAATLVGGAYCEAAWTTATNVGTGEFLIKGYDTSSITSKVALLVAGYNAADTVNAATYVRTQAFDTTKEYKGTSATSATLVVADTTE